MGLELSERILINRDIPVFGIEDVVESAIFTMPYLPKLSHAGRVWLAWSPTTTFNLPSTSKEKKSCIM